MFKVQMVTQTGYNCMCRTGRVYPAKIVKVQAKDEEHACALAKVHYPMLYVAKCERVE